MIGKKWAAFFTVFLAGATLTSPQSLVELAKKEKARRERLKNRKTVVVTNADLTKINKQPGVRVASSPPSPDRMRRSPTENIPVRPVGKSRSGTGGRAPSASIDALERELKQADEKVGTLTLQLSGLWRELYTLGASIPSHVIQQQISFTYLQLQKAKLAADELRARLEKAPAANENK